MNNVNNTNNVTSICIDFPKNKVELKEIVKLREEVFVKEQKLSDWTIYNDGDINKD